MQCKKCKVNKATSSGFCYKCDYLVTGFNPKLVAKLDNSEIKVSEEFEALFEDDTDMTYCDDEVDLDLELEYAHEQEWGPKDEEEPNQ